MAECGPFIEHCGGLTHGNAYEGAWHNYGLGPNCKHQGPSHYCGVGPCHNPIMQQQRGVGGGASEHTPHQVGQVVANLVVKYGNIEFE
jgi:hypothetical protein